MPGFTFPTVGPLCLSSPPTQYGCSASRTIGTMIRCDYQSPFSELFFPFFSDTLQAPSSVCVPSLSARWTGWKHLLSSARALVFRQYPSSSDDHGKEAIGSPKFPSYPRKYMPRSKTPVVSCTLAFIVSRTAAFHCLQSVGFPSLTRVYPLTTIIPISRLNSAACTLDSPSSVLPLLGLHVGFTTSLLALALTGWDLQ